MTGSKSASTLVGSILNIKMGPYMGKIRVPRLETRFGRFDASVQPLSH